MLGDIHKTKPEYVGQLTVYHGQVNVCILCTSSFYYNSDIKLWVTVMDKSFGKMFRSAPRQIDWERAEKWMKEQLSFIQRYTTDIRVEPKELK